MEAPKYFLLDELNRYVNESQITSLKCFHLNAQSARNKVAQLELLFDQFSFIYDVIIIAETWYTMESEVLNLPGYKSIYLNRPTGRGGGVAVLIREIVACEVLSGFSCITDDYEVLTIRSDKYIFVALYRPPKGNVVEFLHLIEKLLSFVTDNKYDVVIGGDININMLAEDSTKRDLESILFMNNCINAVTIPTRITYTSESLIDIFITNLDSSRVIARALSYDISDHLYIFMCVTCTKISDSSSEKTFSYHKITLNTLECFRLI